jgi:hypothetical protein
MEQNKHKISAAAAEEDAENKVAVAAEENKQWGLFRFSCKLLGFNFRSGISPRSPFIMMMIIIIAEVIKLAEVNKTVQKEETHTQRDECLSCVSGTWGRDSQWFIEYI